MERLCSQAGATVATRRKQLTSENGPDTPIGKR
jgi:hypothetical protein